MMTYQAAMTKVLGNVTAARAATMLLMNNSDDLNRSIQLVADAADKGGNHISTWAETQSQLSTQLDMAKQRSEALAIQIGTALIPAANGALSGFQDLFDGFQKGNPVLLGLAGVLAGVVTISVANYTVKMIEAGVATVNTFIDMGAGAMGMVGKFVAGFTASEVAVGQFATKAEIAGAMVRSSLVPALGTIGAVAGIAAIGIGIVGANSHAATVPIEEMTAAMADLALKQGDVGKARIDQAFSQWNTVMGQSTSSITSMDGAIEKFTHRDLSAVVNDWADNALQPLVAGMGIVKGEAGQMDDKFKEVGDSLGNMVKGGQADTAAKGFDKIALSFENQGKSAQDALDTMPGYKQSLTDLASTYGLTLAPAELLDLAMGKLPQKMIDAAGANQTYVDSAGNTRTLNADVAKSLDDLGISIDGQITDLGKLYDAMVKTGLANLSARDAEFRFGDAVQKASSQADELKAKLKGDLSSALDGTGKDFNKTTAAGQEAEAAFSSVTQAGLQNASIMAHDVTKGQVDVQGALQGTYDNMIKTAEKFHLGSGAAEDLTRKVLGIPKGVDIKSWMSDTAKRMAEQTKGAIDNVPKDVGVSVHLYGTGEIQAALDSVNALQHAAGNAMLTANRYASGAAYSNKWTGGMAGEGIPGLASGGAVSGVVPGRAPQNPRMDNILALVNGKPLAVRSGEFINNESSTKANLSWLKAMNAGLKMSDLFADHTPRLAYASTPGAAQHATTNITNNNNARTVTNNVTISSTADARSLAAEFSRMTANM
jgi:hypothetical protein